MEIGKGLIKKSDNEEVEITLGRYKFDLEDGTPLLVQKGSERDDDDPTFDIGIDNEPTGYFRENTNTGRTNVFGGGEKLDEFIRSVETNHGYYIARYEAGKGDGDKPVSRVGEVVWNNITQSRAAEVSHGIYEGKESYASDLVNSYAWDTAIVYIQAMGNKNYANRTVENLSIQNTGVSGDERCHICDMAGNVYEWTTEYSTLTVGDNNYPCVFRGMYDGSSTYFTASRYYAGSGDFALYNGFRPLLYLK